MITLFAGADESTFLHELGHLFLMDLDALDVVSAHDRDTVDAWAQWHEGAAKEYEGSLWAEELRAHEAAIAAGDAIAEQAARERWRQQRELVSIWMPMQGTVIQA